MTRLSKLPVPLIALLVAASPAFAHVGAGHSTDGFAAGLAHPVGGLDHVLAMVAVGLLAARMGGRALWLLPVTFVAVMALAAGMGASNVALPFVEPGIAASILVLGLAVAWWGRMPEAMAVGLCALFAIFHGHAHGAELAQGAGFAPYMAGFALATALLHGAGIAVGLGVGAALANREAATRWTWTAAGSALAVAGGVLLTGIA